ncbi:MAG: hypothetical protein Q8R90_02420 [Bacteroidales bacterium]|nr:hypothetical protein [Bacteroidales bacterium]
MKKIRTFISILTGLIIILLNNQKISAQDVNGMKLTETYNYTYVINKFGTPDSYWSGPGEDGLDEEYYYGPNLFRFSENGCFGAFTLEDNRFAVFTLDMQGGIKVGDSVTKFNQLGFGQLISRGNNHYEFKGRGDAWFDIYHNNGIITLMCCSFPS